ncbi:IRF tryptophan pentad repeat domain-containing protein [Trichonephila clavipes]|nr:IRF tryptophan pentad repeat domain-containing protein [Trichonephila clavipes]
MPSKESPLVNFLMNSLMDNKYPNILFWVNKAEGIFCLRCICKYQKIWSEDASRIFEDYFKLKSRKSESKRQTFLLALKASPSIETLKNLSTKEEKYYKFLNKSGNLPYLGMISCKNEVAEVSKSLFSTSIDALCNEFKHKVAETCFTIADMNVSCAEVKDELINIAAESSRFVNAETTNVENINSGVDENELTEDKILNDLCEILDDADSILNIRNDDFTVPDIEMDISEFWDNPSQTIFSGYYDVNNSNSNSCPGFFDSSEDQNYPADYDPITELFQSFEKNRTLNQLKSIEDIPSLSSESSQYAVKGVYSIDSNDLVKLLEKDEISSDHTNHNYYMMILKTSKP